MKPSHLKINIAMKNLFTLVFVCSILSASAQASASIKIKDKNPVCLERGHNIIYTKSTTNRPSYTIDTKDSTVTVQPSNTIAKCTRCGSEVENEKDSRITTWRRVEKATETITKTIPARNVMPVSKSTTELNTTDWGNNGQRGVSSKLITSTLNDIKKVATLRNDTLFIHKRVAPFKSIKEQLTETTTIIYKNKPITFKAAIFDESTFYSGKNGLEIF